MHCMPDIIASVMMAVHFVGKNRAKSWILCRIFGHSTREVYPQSDNSA